MLTIVEITNSQSNTLRLPLQDSSGGYSVRDIGGLDPVSAALTTSSVAQADGAQPQNARRDTRNITMKLGLEPDYISNSVQSLRSDLYDYLMPKSVVQLGFYIDDVLFAVISGQVEDLLQPMFSDNPEADISIICYNPDFMSPDPQVVISATSDVGDTADINYLGNSPTGVIFELDVNADISAFQIYNTTPSGDIQTMPVSGPFVTGDVVTITTITGSKSVILTRGGISTSILYALDQSASWISLEKGDNFFRGFADGLMVPFTVTFTPLFGGL